MIDSSSFTPVSYTHLDVYKRQAYIHEGRIAQRTRNISEEQGSKKPLDQSAAGLASGAVSHFDLRIAKPDGNPLGLRGVLSTHAIELRLVRAALRCS